MEFLVNNLNLGFYSTASFEFNYLVSSLKYLFFNFVILGFLPLLFEKMNLNKSYFNKLQKKPSLFTQSLFSIYNSKEDNYPNYIKNKELYSKSIIVGGVEAKRSLENLEFIMGKQTLTDQNVLSPNQDQNEI